MNKEGAKVGCTNSRVIIIFIQVIWKF